MCRKMFNPLNAKLNPICYLLALGAHTILHVSRIRVNEKLSDLLSLANIRAIKCAGVRRTVFVA